MVRLVIDGAGKLAALRREAIARINARTGEVRGRFITISPGQEMIYLGKEAEALRYLAEVQVSGAPDLSGFPFMAAEIGITAPTPLALAQLWVAMAAQWRQIGSVIEQARLGAVAGVEQATGAPAIAAAVAGWEAAAAEIEELANA